MTVHARLLDSLSEVSATAWDALHGGDHPFVAHAFLHGLEQHGCLREDWGWRARHLTLWRGEQLIGALPGYRKTDSHGEFVFDYAWAQAYSQHGLRYFPKWLFAVPYSPVTGPRLLAREAGVRRALLEAALEQLRMDGWSSAHVNFHPVAEDGEFGGDWMRRTDVQYHWRNDAGWADFEAFLAAFDHKHRKNIRQERAKVAKAGIGFRVLHGDEASDEDLDAMFGFYLMTFRDHGNAPALTRAFFHHLARTMPRQLVLFLADREGEPIAGALCLRSGRTLYGRYWGAREQVSGLHFETCYYQGIEYCLREGLSVFEPGAQGEHKIARGFLPTPVYSRHWVADPVFRTALADWCGEEEAAIARYARNLAGHSPFKV